MAKIDSVQEVSLDLLRPYENNAKIHSEDQVNKIAESIQAFGFLNPCLIDKDYNIIAGHGRVMASKKLGRATVPCIFIEGLTDAQRRAYILADNRLTEFGTWSDELLAGELEELADMDFDIDLTGFTFDVNNAEWFEHRERYDNDDEDQDDEYKEFVEKFEPKRTTDDCYTPDCVYDAIAEFVENRYGVQRSRFVRPFYPGGDYQAENYPTGSVVVDNPPFSILSEILRWYTEHGMKFFLFAPGLTGLSSAAVENCTLIATGSHVIYENGAIVPTSFVTNLEGDTVVMTCPELWQAVDDANAQEKEKRGEKGAQPKYRYPSNVLTQAMLNDWSKWGIRFSVKRSECIRIQGLDAQREAGKAIFGGGLLLAEKARQEAEKARQEAGYVETSWQLSEREKRIIEEMNQEKAAVLK